MFKNLFKLNTETKRRTFVYVCTLSLSLNLILMARPNMVTNNNTNSVINPENSSIQKQGTTSSKIKWQILGSRTKISFKVKHFVLMEVEGKFKDPSGYVETNDIEDFSNAKVSANIPVNTIQTGNEDRDIHLKTDEFFNEKQFPTMNFESTKVTKKNNASYIMDGNLTIRNVSKPITLEVTNLKSHTNPDGSKKSKFVASGMINRYDYGLTWNELTETGSMVVGKDVNIELDVTIENSK